MTFLPEGSALRFSPQEHRAETRPPPLAHPWGRTNSQLSTGVWSAGPSSSRLMARRAGVRFPMEGGLVRQTQPGGPVTHLPPRLIFHTGPRGVGGGHIPKHPLTSGPSAFISSWLWAQGWARIPFFPRLGTHGHPLAPSFPPVRKRGLQRRRGWLRSGERSQVTGWNEGLTPNQWWS